MLATFLPGASERGGEVVVSGHRRTSPRDSKSPFLRLFWIDRFGDANPKPMSKLSSHCRIIGNVRSMRFVATTLLSTLSTPVPGRSSPLWSNVRVE